MVSPKVSVVIPTYNCAGYLRETIDSVVGQSFQDWELIVVNNFSTDDTIAVVESYDNDKIRLINFDNKGVIAAARNRGASLASAPFIAFLDSDDVWEKDKLKASLDAFDDGVDVVFTGMSFFGTGRLFPPTRPDPAHRYTFRDALYRHNPAALSTSVLRRASFDSVGGFREDPKYVRAEDWDLWLRLFAKGNCLKGLADPLTRYRLHEGNASKAQKEALMAKLAVLNWHHDHRDQKHILDGLYKRQRLATFYYSAARSLQLGGQKDAAKEYFVDAIKSYPLHWKTYAAWCMK